jgi:antitoxin (DNA-binding transcriptional repressor) of toxin-antitoxin stability system
MAAYSPRYSQIVAKSPYDSTEVASGSYYSFVRAVRLKVLKNKLSEYVRLAYGGETILVTDRDQVVAELVPPRVDRTPSVADRVLVDLVRQGWLTPAVRPITEPPSRAPITTLRALMHELDDDRTGR